MEHEENVFPITVSRVMNKTPKIAHADELALRLAWTHTGRRGTIVVDGAYHGNTATLVSLSPYKCEGPGGGGLAPFARKVPLPDPYRGRYRAPDATLGERYAAHLDLAIERRQAGETRIHPPDLFADPPDLVNPNVAAEMDLARQEDGVVLAWRIELVRDARVIAKRPDLVPRADGE